MATGTRNILTIQQRLDVLKDLEEYDIFTVANKYGITPFRIRRIQNNAAKLSTFTKHQKRHKFARAPIYQELEDRLVPWFKERKALHDNITNRMLMEKAIELRDSIESCSSFKVSRNWLRRFKKSHNIRVMKIKGEKDRKNKNTAWLFVHELNQLIKKENIALENLYNMDETGLLWKALPSKPRTGVQKECVGGFKLMLEEITIGLCANATGTHKIMPLVIYNYKKLGALRNRMETLPVVLKSHNSICLTQEVFIDWYSNYFIPSVRRYQLEKGILGKVILLVDNYSGHKNLLNHPQDDYFKIMYLPTNTTLLIQPMHQGIIMKTKRGFRHRMMQTAFKYSEELETFWEWYNLQHCIDMLASSWDAISIRFIKNAWKKIIGFTTRNMIEDDNLMHEMQSFMTAVSKQDVTLENVRQFLYYCELRERKRFVDMEEDEEDDENESGENNEIEMREDNKIGNEEDDEIENREDDEIENREDIKIENGEDYEIENREDIKIENREDDEIENREDIKIGNGEDDEIENREDINIENGVDDEIENREDMNIENRGDDEIENEDEDQGHQDESKETNNDRDKNEEASELRKSVCEGINVSETQKQELEYIFLRLKSYNPYVPLSTQRHLEAMKICYLGDSEE